MQEALEGIEFISGPPDSPWGSVRAAMGRPEPWALNYVAIGNEVGQSREVARRPWLLALRAWRSHSLGARKRGRVSQL